MNEESKLSIAEAHLHFARQINGRVWALMDKDKRTQAENDEMLYAAHACTYHWLHAGTAVHQQRGEWLISHVHGALDNAREALRHAERCLALTEACKGEMQDFDIAYAYEGLARAHAQAGHGNPAFAHQHPAVVPGHQEVAVQVRGETNLRRVTQTR